MSHSSSPATAGYMLGEAEEEQQHQAPPKIERYTAGQLLRFLHFYKDDLNESDRKALVRVTEKLPLDPYAGLTDTRPSFSNDL